jgi:hypothetical protein
MRVNGQLRICDRCGKQIFCKTTGDGETDGGFTRWNKFEEAEGWTSEYKIGDLCPSCTNEYKELIESFKGGAK